LLIPDWAGGITSFLILTKVVLLKRTTFLDFLANKNGMKELGPIWYPMPPRRLFRRILAGLQFRIRFNIVNGPGSKCEIVDVNFEQSGSSNIS